MALTERKEIDKIELVTSERIMQVREAVIVERDGVEIARGFSRRVIETDAEDDPNEAEEIRALRAVVHTPERKAARASIRADNSPRQEK